MGKSDREANITFENFKEFSRLTYYLEQVQRIRQAMIEEAAIIAKSSRDSVSDKIDVRIEALVRQIRASLQDETLEHRRKLRRDARIHREKTPN